MQELNEKELEQVVGGAFQFNFGTTANSGGGAGAVLGGASSKSVSDSTLTPFGSNSFAANSSSAHGLLPQAASSAGSTSGITFGSN